jgi:uncharacterized RDD family membrane protein YckC
MALYKFAGFWRRLVAFTIDSTIIFIVFIILSVISSIALITGAISADNSSWFADLLDPARLFSAALFIACFYTILSIAYFTYFHGTTGRTPGKMLLGLQVLSTEGNRINFGFAFLRSVGYIISSLLFTIPLGFIWAAFDRRKQGWHDKIAGTVVIIRPQENNAAGLIIPEPAATLNVPLAAEKQTEKADQTVIKTTILPDDENHGYEPQSKL